jgi:hypothetical protein
MQNFPKKRFDLSDFLSQKGKPKTLRPNYARPAAATNAPKAKPAEDADETATDKEG